MDLFVGIVKCLCGRQSCTSILEKTKQKQKKKLSTYHWKSFESVPGEERLKMGWVVKKSVFSFLNALSSTKLHSCSKPIYFAINIYYFQHPPHHLKIRPPFRGVLGRISALIIEVLYHICFKALKRSSIAEIKFDPSHNSGFERDLDSDLHTAN